MNPQLPIEVHHRQLLPGDCISDSSTRRSISSRGGGAPHVVPSSVEVLYHKVVLRRHRLHARDQPTGHGARRKHADWMPLAAQETSDVFLDEAANERPSDVGGKVAERAEMWESEMSER